MKKNTGRYSGIGGQAVLEGIMMKNKEKYAVAVRTPEGTIAVDVQTYAGVGPKTKLKELPFIRGIFQFIDSMVLGMRALNYSASFYEEEDGEEKDEKKESIIAVATTVVSFILAIAIFMLLPYFISNYALKNVRNDSLVAILEGVFRIIIFIVYILLISLMKDIKRTFQYHGAEHKCINCIEKGRPLTVEDVMKSSRLHKRCGTSFILFVMLVSIILFFFIRVENPLLKVGLRILMIPLISGVSYEIIRLAGRSNNLFVRIVSAPGMWLQRLTTREPDPEMVQGAIGAVEAVFDWKAYLKEAFGYEVDDSWLRSSDEALEEDLEEAEKAAAQTQ